MNKFKLVIVFWNIYSQPSLNRFYKSLTYFKKLLSENSKLMILDLTKFSLVKIDNNYFHNDKEIEYLKIRNFHDLKKIKKKLSCYKKIYALGPVSSDFKSFFIFIIMRWLNLKLIFISNFGYYLKEKNASNLNFVYKLKKFFILRSSYYFSKIFSIISIFPDIEYYFETSKERIDNMNNTFFKKIFFFKKINKNKIIRINSFYYDNIILNKEKIISKEYIVLIDSGFDHPDRQKFEKIKNELEHDIKRKKYFKNLYNLMKNFEKAYNKKIIFCKHPKTNYELNDYFKLIENEFITINGKSDEFLEKAEIVIFTGASSMVNKAIILKKKILYAFSKNLGKHITDKVFSFLKLIDLTLIDLDQFKFLDKKLIDLKMLENINLYDKFIKNNLILEKNICSYDQIKQVLYK
ncbi:hypothetical protein [Candidatus Pelagibacter sp.]|uniref:hypothetical protein n=1 Tax=Candidatus Pelagibacter sp. TaxID=2024849 RepID=UPI003F848FC8